MARWLFHCADALTANAQFDITPQWLNRLVLGPHVPRLQAWPRPIPTSACWPAIGGPLSLKGRGTRPKNLPERRQPEREHGMK